MRMREFSEDTRVEEQELLRQAEWHRKLWSMPEFRAFRDFAEKHARSYMESLCESTATRTEQVTDEYLKGAIYGLRLPFKRSEHIMQLAGELRAAGVTEEDEADGR